MGDPEKDFSSMQKALYFSLGFELLGALLFLLTGLYVVADRVKATEVERREAGKPTPLWNSKMPKIHQKLRNDILSHFHTVLLAMLENDYSRESKKLRYL